MHVAKRSLGQNFLVDPNVSRKIVAALAPEEGDLLLEIGPGQGALTRLLDAAPHRLVVALEKDRDLARALAVALPRVAVVLGDAMEFPWERLCARPRVRLVSNLPYNVASPILWDFVSRCRSYLSAVVMVQHEVALRLAAGPGGRDYGALSAWVQSFARVEYRFKVPPTVFRPRPKVDSAVVRLTPLAAEQWPASAGSLAAILRTCFQQRRKQLGTILRPLPGAAAALAAVGIDPRRRPETLGPMDFQRLGLCLGSVADGAGGAGGAGDS